MPRVSVTPLGREELGPERKHKRLLKPIGRVTKDTRRDRKVALRDSTRVASDQMTPATYKPALAPPHKAARAAANLLSVQSKCARLSRAHLFVVCGVGFAVPVPNHTRVPFSKLLWQQLVLKCTMLEKWHDPQLDIYTGWVGNELSKKIALCCSVK